MDQIPAQPFSFPPASPPVEPSQAPQPVSAPLLTPSSPSPAPFPVQDNIPTISSEPILAPLATLPISPIEPTTTTSLITDKKSLYQSWTFWLMALLATNIFLFVYFWLWPRISPPIVVKDQTLEARLQIDKLRADTNGFLVLRAQIGGPPGLTIAKTSLLIPDTYQNFSLSLETGEDLPGEFLASIIPGSVIQASFYKDMDKNGQYNPDIDTEIATDILGKKSQTSFVIKSTI